MSTPIQPIQYTSRTFLTVLADINSIPELADLPENHKVLIAGSHEVLSFYENSIANNGFLRTAFTRQSVMDLCELINYFLYPKTPSSGTLLFYFNPSTVTFQKTVTQANLSARSSGSITASSLKFEARAGQVFTAFSETFTASAGTDLLTVARTYMTGEKVRVSTSTTLPAPLAAGIDYYVIYVSSTTIKLATSIANAYLGTFIDITSAGTGTQTITLYSGQVTVYQQDTKTSYICGTSDGVTHWQEFDLQYLDVLKDTITLTINGATWTRVDTVIDSLSTDHVFMLRYKTDGASSIMFGNGTMGAIPGNFPVYANHAVGGGLSSNISQLNRVNQYAGSDSDIMGVSNATAMTGGSDAEDIANAKIQAPILLKALNRFVTVTDGRALVLNYGGVFVTDVIRNAYGPLSCQVPIVPTGGGLPSAGLKSSLQTYLINLTVLSGIDVRVTDPTYVTFTPIATIHVKSGYVFANIKPAILLALRLISSEYTAELVQYYNTNGISLATTAINTKWSMTFTSADYAQVERLLENVTAPAFGVSLQLSDVDSFVGAYVYGVDYILLSSPSFPLTVAAASITTDNVISGNITEV